MADDSFETHDERSERCTGLSADASATDGQVVVRVAGELDMNTVPVLSDRLEHVVAQERALVVVDMSAVGFCDSQGLALLIRWQQRAQRDGFTMVVRSPSPALRRLFELTDTDGLLNVE